MIAIISFKTRKGERIVDQIFGDRLRLLRKRKGMTQSDLARAMGVTLQTIVRYEGLTLEEVRPARLKAFAQALDVDERELTGEADLADSEDIRILTRGLQQLSPERRKALISLVMPYILQNQEEADLVPARGEEEAEAQP